MLGFKPTEFATGLRATYRTYLKKRGYAKPDFTFADHLVSRFNAPGLSSQLPA